MIELAERVQKRLTGVVRKWANEAPVRRFMRFARRRWPQRGAAERDSVVLIGLFPCNPLVFCNAYTVNALAEKHGSRIEAYQFFGRVNPLLRDLYASFGARLALTAAGAAPHEERVQAHAAEILKGLKTKWDVIGITVDGVLIGDQIYDSYIRFYNEVTVQLDDPRFHALVAQALRIFYACRDYLARNRVTAFIADDFSYISSGIITRLVFLAKVPIYQVGFGEPFTVIQADDKPSGAGHNFPPAVFVPYYDYPKLFATLGEEQRKAALIKARETIEARLAGKFCPHVRMHKATYEVGSGRVLDDGPEPRILIMLHDFVDSPHGFRDLLFPDFYEWMNFLLERAAKTPFKWYVKPHPCLSDPSRASINAANEGIIAKFASRFPAINFLPATASNHQILQDGVDAMFTVHGTSGHEYAYSGIPVVNCGDNPHIAYDFNIHVKSLEEYEKCIFEADRLKVEIKQESIEEFIYMHYFYLRDRLRSPVNPIDERILARPNWPAELNQNSGFDEMIAGVTPERERGVAEYFEHIFAKPHLLATT